MMEKRLIAFDYGEKRVGIAITDPLRIFAYPLVTLNNDNTFWQKLQKIFDEHDIEKIILGYPLKESGERSVITDKVEEFEKQLVKKLKKEVIRVDERYSSSIAKDRILESVPKKKKRRDKSLLDKTAAYLLLQEYLETEG